MPDYSPLTLLLLVVTGVIAGFINTLAGGGSNLTIPALMIMGLPADIANGTNRVGVMMQSIGSLREFRARGKLAVDDLPGILTPALAGGVVGAVLVAVMPATLLKPILLGTMIGLAALMLVRPGVVQPSPGTPVLRVRDCPRARWSLFFAGVYGGFVQAGVGFVLIAALAGTLRYDLVRANALKIACTMAFTLVALIIFIVDDLVLWIPGLILGCSTVVGATVAVRFAVNVSQRTLRWFLLIMTVCASAAAMLT